MSKHYANLVIMHIYFKFYEEVYFVNNLYINRLSNAELLAFMIGIH